MTVISIPAATLSAAWPLSLVFSNHGSVLAVGRTVERLVPNLIGQHLARVLNVEHPSAESDAHQLLARTGERLQLRLKSPSGAIALRGVIYPLEGGHGLLLLSFGAGIANAVRRYDLDAHDFSVIDPTLELLFVLEASSAISDEIDRLDARLEEARRTAENSARTDSLTGLPNRRVLDHTLDRLAACPVPRFGIMQLDLDRFKVVNDTLGHAAGDAVLSRVSEILAEEVRQGDLVTRIGGDEFVLVFPDCDDMGVLVAIGERIIARLEQPILFEGQECRISGSAGVALASSYANIRIDRMLADADRALYASKEGGRARVSVAHS
jgi:diguanylate cyclase (GGDEF)-like protein